MTVPARPRWLEYEDGGQTWSAAYLDGALVQANGRGFYRADFQGGHIAVADAEIEAIRRCHIPDGPPVWPPHLDLGDGGDADRITAGGDRSAKPDPSRQLRTDAGNANRLVAAFGEDLRWVPQWGAWLTWDGRRWSRDAKGKVFELAKIVAQRLWDDALGERDDERKAAIKWAQQSEGAPRLEAMVKLARTADGIPVEPHELDGDPWLLNVHNGTVDLRTGKLRGHRRQDLITKLAGTHYDPAATAPVFWQTLERVQTDPEVRDYLQRAVGYSLSGLTREQALFLLWGSGSNGKTTILEALLAVFGDYATNAEADLLMVRSDTNTTGIADLAGARFVVSTEVQDGKRLDEAAVKRLTGSDTVTARHLYQDFFRFTPSHKLWIAANHRPVVRGTDHAIWRRLKLIPFTVTIADDEKDQRLAEKLSAELPGILTWALIGCGRWQRHGLGEPDAIRAAGAEYRQAEDTVAAFIADECISRPDVWTFAGDLYTRYQSWAKASGEYILSQKRLGAILTDKGYDRYQSGKTRWRGIALAGPMDGTMERLDPLSEKSSHTHTCSDYSQTGLNGSMVPPSEGDDF